MSAVRNDLARRIQRVLVADGVNVVSVEYRDDPWNLAVLLVEHQGERHHVRIIDVRGLENDAFVPFADQAVTKNTTATDPRS